MARGGIIRTMRGGLICLYGIWKQWELAVQLVGSSACRVGVLRYAATQMSPDGSRRDLSGSAKALAR